MIKTLDYRGGVLEVEKVFAWLMRIHSKDSRTVLQEVTPQTYAGWLTRSWVSLLSLWNELEIVIPFRFDGVIL